MTPQQWHAAVTIRRWSAQPTDDQLDEITRVLPGYGIIVDTGVDRVRLEMTIEATTVRQAADAAVRAARTAHSQAIGSAPEVTALRVITAEDHERENEAFPDPVARLAAGPVYTRGSIDAFDAGWQRKPGRPKTT